MRARARQAILLAFALGMGSISASTLLAQDSKENGTVTGRVLVDGKPAQGIVVMAAMVSTDPTKLMEQMLKPGATRKAVTDSDGRYRLEALAVGKYHISPSVPTLINLDEYGDSKQLTVAEAPVEDINFSLSRGGVITGKVTDSEGNPVIAEEISLKPVDISKPGGSPSAGAGRMYYTDDRGIYRIFGLAPGRYIVSTGASRNPMTSLFTKGPKRVQTFYPGVTEQPKAKPVEVMAGAEASGVDIKLGTVDKGFTVSGRVLTAETGAPIANAMIGYSPRPREVGQDQEHRDNQFAIPSGMTSTNAKGEFRLDSVSPGNYKMEVVSMGGLTSGSQFYMDAVNFEVQSTNIDKLEIKVHLGASISGSVVVENTDTAPTLDGPIPLILIAASSTRQGSQAMGRVVADGTFRIGGLKAGKTNIRTLPYSVQKFSIVRIEHNGIEQSDGIEIQENEQITGVRVVVAPANCVINGHVTIQGGTLSPDSEIFAWARPLTSTADGSRSFDVDAKGNFNIENLAPGNYEVEVSVTVPGSGGGRRLSAKQSVTVNAGVPAELSLTLNLKTSDK